MGGGAGIGSGAAVAPYNPTNNTVHQQMQSSKQHKFLSKPLGFKNIGNTCYANAALQCLLSTALTHALLDPTKALIFRRYSSNSNLLALGSGSVDSCEDDDDYYASEGEDIVLTSQMPNDEYLDKESRSDQISSSPMDRRKAERRQKRLLRRKEKQKKIGMENCRWLTRELTVLTRAYAEETQSDLELNEKGMLSSLFSNILVGQNEEVVDPGAITRHVNRLSPCLKPYQQEDAHEFLRALLSTLTMEGQNRELSSLFDGLLESAVTCQTCNRASITRDRYMDLSLDIQDSDTNDLVGALNKFTETEILDDDNKVVCSKCKVKRSVTKGLRLATAPSILVCHLKRFAFDMYGRTTRLKKEVKYPQYLEIGDYMSRANRGKPPPYELVGVLVHTGQRCDRGHYVAYVKSGYDWFKANDASVTKSSLQTALGQQAYILIYEVEGMKARHGVNGYGKSHKNNCHDKKLGAMSSSLNSIDTLSRSEHQPKYLEKFHQTSTGRESQNLERAWSENSIGQADEFSVKKERREPLTFLERILNLCNSSTADAVRDAMCVSDEEKTNPVQNSSKSVDIDLKLADSLSSDKMNSTESKSSLMNETRLHHSDIFRDKQQFRDVSAHSDVGAPTFALHHSEAQLARLHPETKDVPRHHRASSDNFMFNSFSTTNLLSLEGYNKIETDKMSKRPIRRKIPSTTKSFRSGSAPRPRRRSLSRPRNDASLPPLPRRNIVQINSKVRL
mmetsp:Transcript_226/g.349  ORF Transcript_226/g.349 Transcript_226/m.349 type:complete len:733 (-) Transcript_226:156-2354(-)